MENRLTREAALARMAEIERELARLEAEASGQGKPKTFADVEEAYAGKNAPGMFDSEGVSPEQNAAFIRYGLPLAAGFATGPAAGIAALGRAALIGGTAAGAGEAGAQAVEKVAEGQEYRPGQIVGATVRGSAPMFKGAPGYTIGTSALTGLLGGAAEGKVEGFKSGAYEAGVSALGPAFVEAVGGVGRNVGRFLSRGVSRAEDIERIGPGVEATVGQAFPELAGLESRVAAQTGSQALKERLNQQAEAITRAVVGVSGMPAETYPDIVRRVASTMSNMDPASIERLANEADAVNTARNAVEKARTGAQKSLLQESLSEAENEFRKRIDLETMAGGIKAGGVQPFQSAAMGREVETVFDGFTTGGSDQIGHDFQSRVDWNCEADSLGADTDGDIDTDNVTFEVEKGAAGVTWVDIRVGLDQVLVFLSDIDGDIAVQGADDSLGNSILVSEWVSDCDNGFASHEVGACAELDGG